MTIFLRRGGSSSTVRWVACSRACTARTSIRISRRSRATCIWRRRWGTRTKPWSTWFGLAIGLPPCSRTRKLPSTTGARLSCSPWWGAHPMSGAASSCCASGTRSGALGNGAGARTTFEEAIEGGRRLGNGELLARAALGYVTALGGFLLVARWEVGGSGAGLLEEALAVLPPGDGSLRAHLLAHLAREMWLGHEPVERRVAVSEEAIAMARRLGDSEALVMALHSRHWALTTPGMALERLAHAEEMLRVAKETVAPEIEFLAHNARFHCFLLSSATGGGWTPKSQAMVDGTRRAATAAVLPLAHRVPADAAAATLDLHRAEPRSGGARTRPVAPERVRDLRVPLRADAHDPVGTGPPPRALARDPRPRRAIPLDSQLAGRPRQPPSSATSRWHTASSSVMPGATSRTSPAKASGSSTCAPWPRPVSSSATSGAPSSSMSSCSHTPTTTPSPTPNSRSVPSLRLGSLAALLGRWKETDRHFASALARCELLGARAIRARILLEHARALAARPSLPTVAVWKRCSPKPPSSATNSA